MAEMTTWEWFSRAWGSIIVYMTIPLGILTFGISTMASTILGPILIWVMPWFMFGEVATKDFKTGSFAANHAVKIAEIDVAELIKFFLNIIFGILDVFQTPGGLKIDEDSIETWRDDLSIEGNWKSNTWDLYWWDYLQKTNFTLIKNREDIVANEGGDYKIADALLDVALVVAAVVLVFLFAKKGSQMATAVGGIFKKQKTRKRMKASKSRESSALIKLDEIKLTLKEMSNSLRRQNKLIQSTQMTEINPDLDTIIAQTKQRRLRL